MNVVVELATYFLLATECLCGLKQYCHRLNHEDFESDDDNLTVMKNSAMMIRQTSWSKIEVKALIEFAHLAESLAALSLLFEDRAAPGGVIATAGSFG